jgi:hypothetical protein
LIDLLSSPPNANSTVSNALLFFHKSVSLHTAYFAFEARVKIGNDSVPLNISAAFASIPRTTETKLIGTAVRHYISFSRLLVQCVPNGNPHSRRVARASFVSTLLRRGCGTLLWKTRSQSSHKLNLVMVRALTTPSARDSFFGSNTMRLHTNTQSYAPIILEALIATSQLIYNSSWARQLTA